MNRETAEKIDALLREYLKRLDDSTRLVKESGSDEDFVAYRRAVGEIMGPTADILNDIYREHPDLKPKYLK